MRGRHRERFFPLDQAPPGALVLGVALVGLLVLGVALAWTAPVPVPLVDVVTVEGARVAVEGRVLAAGARSVVLADATARVTAFLPRGHPVPFPGDEVVAVGTVTRAAGGLALSLERLMVVTAPEPRILTVGDLAREPARYGGSPVLVVGLLERPRGEGWRLVDPWTGGSVALDVSPVPEEWEDHDRVEVEGRFRLDERRLRYEVAVVAWRSTSP